MIVAAGLTEHQANTDDAADDGAEESAEGGGNDAIAALPDHIGDQDQSHTEGGAQITQSGDLIRFKVCHKLFVFGQRQNRGVIRDESGEDPQRSGAGQPVQPAHQRRDQLVEKGDHTELRQQGGKGAGDHRNGHDEKDRIQKQVVGGVHDGVEHLADTHHRTKIDKQRNYRENADKCFS